MKIPAILIADDDAEDRFILNDSFLDINQPDLTIDFCEDGIAVMEYLTKALLNNALPDLIILDLNMPRMTGKEALTEIKKRKEYNHIPVIIFSTSGADYVKEECISLGALEYLIKPTDYKNSIALAQYFYGLAANAITS